MCRLPRKSDPFDPLVFRRGMIAMHSKPRLFTLVLKTDLHAA
jgi:hypothetical protein